MAREQDAAAALYCNVSVLPLQMKREDFAQLKKFLAATPDNVRLLVINLSDHRLRWKPAAHDFSCLEHVCHLRDIEREGYVLRIEKLLDEPHPFLADIDGDALARERDYNRQSLTSALTEFRQARGRLIRTISALTDEQLRLTGTFENFGPITLEKMLLMIREHDEQHLRALRDLRDHFTDDGA